MRLIPLIIILGTAWFCSRPAWAGADWLTYQARVVHNNRSEISHVRGQIDLDTGEFTEVVDQSYMLDYRRFPAGLHAARPALPTIWGAPGHLAHQYLSGIPRFDSPLLRHFLAGEVIPGCDRLAAGQSFLDGQLVLDSVERHDDQLEIIGKFRESPMVIVVRTRSEDGHTLPTDMAVLGADAELYQYFFEQIGVGGQPLADLPPEPQFDPARYVEFPASQEGVIPIVPVKDWLVFQAQLPDGRPLNLLFDSGTETMIMDDMVLKVDAQLQPTGDLPVAGALDLGQMQLYEGFSFDAGGVKFRDLPVLGTSLTSINIGAEMRIHGIVGNEILQLCRIDLDLAGGQMHIRPLGTGDPPPGKQLALTFIEDLPHVEAEVEGTGRALWLVDTGQRSSLSVNLDWLDRFRMSDQLKMNGFLGDITGGLSPRYIVEEMNLNLAGRTYVEKSVDAAWQSTYHYDGVPVVGSIGFPLLTSHFGGITFDYGRRSLYLSQPGDDLVFSGRPDAWPPNAAAPNWLARAGTPEAAGAAGQPGPPAGTPPGKSRTDHEANPVLAQDSGVAAAEPAVPSPTLPGLSPDGQEAASATQWSEHDWNLADPLSLIRSTPVPASGSTPPVLPADTIVDQDTGEVWEAPQADRAAAPPSPAEAAPPKLEVPPQDAPQPAPTVDEPAEPTSANEDTLPAAASPPAPAFTPAPPANAPEPTPRAAWPAMSPELVRGALFGLATGLPWPWLRELIWQRLFTADTAKPEDSREPARKGRDLKRGQPRLSFDKTYWTKPQEASNEPES